MKSVLIIIILARLPINRKELVFTATLVSINKDLTKQCRTKQEEDT